MTDMAPRRASRATPRPTAKNVLQYHDNALLERRTDPSKTTAGCRFLDENLLQFWQPFADNKWRPSAKPRYGLRRVITN
ncbi:MAG: hypothetical protein QOD39_913 [Mycobacterium sp.]|nr:hypothetical protein [Mycobacterium sp.]